MWLFRLPNVFFTLNLDDKTAPINSLDVVFPLEPVTAIIFMFNLNLW